MKKILDRNLNMVNWVGKFSSRKGMGMELALLVLFVVFACSTLLVSSAMLGKVNLTGRQEQLVQNAQVDMFAENVLKTGIGSTEYNGENYGYSYEWSEDNTILTVRLDGETLLTVTLGDGKVISWVYR